MNDKSNAEVRKTYKKPEVHQVKLVTTSAVLGFCYDNSPSIEAAPASCNEMVGASCPV